MRPLAWASVGFIAGLGLASCKSYGLNEEHCENNEGDASCLSRYPDGSRPYCGRGTCYLDAFDGCIAEMPADPACSSPCGGQRYGDDPEGRECIDGGTATGGDDDGATGGSADGVTTMGPDSNTGDGTLTSGPTDDDSGMTTSGPMGCTGDDDCTEADAPFCVDTLCAPCSATADPDAACAEKFPDTPACSDSTCVECADDTHCTDATAPICDTTTNTCVPCTSHDQCDGDAACHLVTGECFPAGEVYYVDSGAACPGAGTMASPWCLIQSHIDEIPAAGSRTFHLAAGNTNSENLVVTGNRRVALLGDLAQPAIFFSPGPTESYRLDISAPSSAVFTDAAEFSGNDNFVAVRVNDGTFYASRTAIVQNTPGAIATENTALLHVENSFVGGSESNVPAVSIANSDATILYSTVVAGYGMAARSLACTTPGTVDVRNSVLLGETTADSVQCSGASVTFANNAAEQNLGAGNTTVAEFDGNQVNWFTGHASGDFGLTAGAGNTGEALFCGVAVWETGDPATDIGTDLRPTMDGAPDCAGADIP